jgi:two-component system phosphate regulon response regulator OmpR
VANVRRSRKAPVGIIMLTSKADTVDRVVGLEVGADDYVSKPFELRELLARLRSLLRRLPETADPLPDHGGRIAAFAGWRLDLDRRELSSPAGEPVAITTKEFQVLELLVSRANRPVSRDAIIEHADGRERHPLDRSVDVLVFQLRAKLEELPGSPRILKTVRGVGYMLAARVVMQPHA